MKDNENVLTFAPAGKKPPAEPLPEAVVSLQEKSRTLLLDWVREVFTSADDSLFAMAEKAHRQEEQDGLFAALRDLRVERGKLARKFVDRFDEYVAMQGWAESRREAAAAGHELTLVANDDLEQMVAVDSMVAKASQDFAPALSSLTARIDTLLPEKIYQKNNPFGPDAVSNAFVDAIDGISLHIRARLTVLKKFEQKVMRRLGELYEQCNQQLVEAGILPDLGSKPRKPQKPQNPRPVERPAAARPAAAPPVEPTKAEGQVGSIGATGSEGEVTTIQISMPSQPGAATSIGLLPQDSGAPVLASNDLLNHLAALQLLQLRSSVAGMRILDINSLLGDRLQEVGQSASLAKIDRDIIKLIEMLFSFILEDRNLADPIKILIGRLQLPLLKVAVADKSFFSQGGHPARKLLNTIADAATGWQQSDQYREDPFYLQVSSVVTTVLEGFESDINVFADAVASFNAFIDQQQRRAEVVERRVVDEADGEARTAAARASVESLLATLEDGQELSEVARRWLHDVCARVLYLALVRDGAESDAWHAQVETARDLVWSMVAPMPQNRKEMVALLPGLQKRLQEAAESISLNPFEVRSMFADLKRAYQVRFDLVEADAAPEQTAAEEPSQGEVAHAEVTVPEVEQLEAMAQEPEAAEPEAEGREDDLYWKQTYELVPGSWFEFKRDGEEAFRCRLAAVIQKLDSFIFVNRNGAKVAQFDRHELAAALGEARLIALDDGMLFERALQSVIGNVRKGRGQ
ncbi:DUF1631 domain-containing protein [Biformimicrobium ophioploci]|uniref:DUF1631 domain-containing protein n=1 Tax=Biformimicrobium ophioploci TaxID=3036711 RepID=A0ABQ6LXN6_9GAMM|nr:DUF1631 domain-containing protein [Microbulbifer sp. NKW57]GMG86810.1 DUF1631 domain-containing protein [Microbulbifer sp. NKW57]